MNTLKVTDKVHYRPGFGKDEPKTVTLIDIIICPNEHVKKGNSVLEIEAEKVTDSNIIYDLSDGHWCRGNQIDMWCGTEPGREEWMDEDGII